MRIIVLAQNVPYLVSIGVPENNAQAVLDHLNSIDKKDRGKVLRYLKDNPSMSLDELKNFKIFTQEEKVKAKEEKYSDIPKEMLDWAKSIAPNYIDWILKQVQNESVRPTEDDDNIKTTLKKFESMKRKKDLPKENRDINYYKTFNSLSETLAYLTGESEEAESTEPQIPESDPDLIYNQNGLKIYKFTDFKKCEKLTLNIPDGSNKLIWCTGRGTYYAPPIYMFTLNDYRIVLMHPISEQIKGRLDEAIQDYQIVKLIDAPMRELGIAPPQNSGGDFKLYNLSLKHGADVQDKMAKITEDKYSALIDLQKQKMTETSNDYYNGFKQGSRFINVSFFLNEQDFEDPQVQKYCIEMYRDYWLPEIGTNNDAFFKLYKKTPFGMRMIPEIREMNKKRSIQALQLASKSNYGEENPYLLMGRELKVLQEIQQAYKEFWVIKVKSNPEKYYNSNNIPQHFKKEFRQIYVDAVIDKISEGPDFISKNSDLSWPAYTNCPDDIRALPQIADAVRKGWLTFAYRSTENFEKIPQELQNDQEIIEKNNEGWQDRLTRIEPKLIGRVYKNIPQRVKELPAYASIKKTKIIPYYQAYVRKFTHLYEELPDDIKTDPNMIRTVERIALTTLQDDIYNYSSLPDSIRNLPRVKQIEQKTFLPIWLQQATEDVRLFEKLPENIKALPEIQNANKLAWRKYITTIESVGSMIVNYSSMPYHVKNDPEFKPLIEKYVVPAYLEHLKSIANKSQGDTWNKMDWTTLPAELFDIPSFLQGCRKILLKSFQNEDVFSIRRYFSKIPEKLRTDPEFLAGVHAKLFGKPYQLPQPQIDFYYHPPEIENKHLPEKTKIKNNYEYNKTYDKTLASNWYSQLKISKTKILQEQISELNNELEELDQKENL